MSGYDSNDKYFAFQKETPVEKKDTFYIVHHPYFQATFTIKNPDTTIKQLLNNKKQGFELYNEYMTTNNVYDDILQKLFDGFIYDNVADLEKRLTVLKTLNEETKIDNKTKSESDHVKEFIKNKYEINSKIEDKIKAQDILFMVEDYFVFTINGFEKGRLSFRNKLSKYLLDMGLKKKRFSDGFYYYGLSEKKKFDNKKLNEKNILEQLKADRAKDIPQTNP